MTPATFIDVASMNVLIVALTPILLAVLTTIQLFNGFLARKAADAAAAKAEKVAEVAQKTAAAAAQTAQDAKAQSTQILKTTDKVHVLVNSQMGQQLMLYAITARTLANLTKDPAHIKAADEADKKLAEHQLRQSIVDDKEVRTGDPGGHLND